MNIPTDPLDQITQLTSRLLDGDLTREEEIHALNELLKTTPGGEEQFVLLCELHGMLEMQGSLPWPRTKRKFGLQNFLGRF